MISRVSLFAAFLLPFAIACSSSSEDQPTGGDAQNLTRRPGELNGMCGGFAGIVCKQGLKCQGLANHPDASGTCVPTNDPPPATCLAFPSCDQGDQQVQSQSACLQDDARCYSREMCGTTIWCTGPGAPPVTCEAMPACDEGDKQVENQSACLQDDARCYSREMCGTTIWCTGPAPARPQQ